MYYKNYDPTIHDIYLYGPGNVGLPIGLNPNSLIYGASADFASIIPRYRAFTGTGPIPIPPGTGVTSLPNYYNIKDSPLNIIVGNKSISTSLHYTANKPSDSGLALAKYTGTTSAYPAISVGAWNNSLTGLSYYGPFTGFYNCVPINKISGITTYSTPYYFSGSPEIPGFATGGTFYQIFSDDYGIMDLIGSGMTLSQPIAKKISASTLIQELVEQGMTAEYNISTSTSFTVTIPAINLYLWDGNDKIIPVSRFGSTYAILPGPNPNIKTYYILPKEFVAGFLNTEEDLYSIWVGDSSSQLIYMKNNSLYFVGCVLATSGDGTAGSYSNVMGPLYSTDALPTYNNLGNLLLDKNHYSYPLHQGLTLATQSDFTRLQNSLNNFNTSVNLLYEKWTT